MKKALKWVLLIILLLAVLVLAVLGISAAQRDTVVLTRYSFQHPEIPRGFNGYRILLISDLHEAPFAEQIARHIEQQDPDVVVLAGDMNQLPEESVLETAKLRRLVRDVPMYAVSGNHERQSEEYEEIMSAMDAVGINVLENDSVRLESRGDSIVLIGARDPNEDHVSDEMREKVRSKIEEELPPEPCFTVLLFHRAGMYPDLKDTGVDLILAGDIHGGVIRLPFIGGLIGNARTAREFFPEYSYGYYKEGDGAAMIVSGGCDNNPKKKRYLNPPEVVLVTLESE